jgi:hypothetical protein
MKKLKCNSNNLKRAVAPSLISVLTWTFQRKSWHFCHKAKDITWNFNILEKL